MLTGFLGSGWVRGGMGAAAVLASAGFVASSHADESVVWDFYVETSGEDASWYSTTNIDTGFSGYEYTFAITRADVQVAGIAWISVLGQIDTEDQSGGGTLGFLPVTIVDQTLESSGDSVDAEVGINSSGQGYAFLSNVLLGNLGTGVRLGGTITVAAVPEPTGAALLIAGGLALIAGRRPSQWLRRSA